MCCRSDTAEAGEELGEAACGGDEDSRRHHTQDGIGVGACSELYLEIIDWFWYFSILNWRSKTFILIMQYILLKQ